MKEKIILILYVYLLPIIETIIDFSNGISKDYFAYLRLISNIIVFIIISIIRKKYQYTDSHDNCVIIMTVSTINSIGDIISFIYTIEKSVEMKLLIGFYINSIPNIITFGIMLVSFIC